MNSNLFDIIKRIVAEKGEDILCEPKRVSAIFSDIAKDVPKSQKTAFLKCLEHKFAQLIKETAENERANCKQQLAQKLHEEEGLDLGLCKETLDLLEMALYGKTSHTLVKQTSAPTPAQVKTEQTSAQVSVQSTSPQVQTPPVTAKKKLKKKKLKRNWFTSLWLWLGMIGSVALLVQSLSTWFISWSRVSIVYTILLVFSHYKLLTWDKLGFKIIVFAQIAVFFLLLVFFVMSEIL